MDGTAQSWPRDALPRGTDLHGYEIEAILGRGGFGITYRVRDKIDQVFAIKECFPKQFAVRQGLEVLPTDTGDADVLQECLERFMREAKALVRLSRIGAAGDGVVKVTTFFEAHGTAYIVMEYLAGESLESLLKASPGGIPADRLVDILRRLLHALGCVHDAGLLHRDVKPSNISLREDGRPVLIDFGATRGASTNHTVTFTKIFSESYSPIEQFSGGEQGAFSDIYALGMTCYRAIGGTAIDAFTRQQALLRGRRDPLAAAAQVGAGRYPASLLAAIDGALAVAPDDRPQSVGAMLALLGGDDTATVVVRTAEPAPAARAVPRDPPPAPPPPALAAKPAAQAEPPLTKPHRGLWLAGAVVLLLVLGGWGGMLAWQHHAAVTAAQQAAAEQTATAAARKLAAEQAAADQALAVAAQRATAAQASALAWQKGAQTQVAALGLPATDFLASADGVAAQAQGEFAKADYDQATNDFARTVAIIRADTRSFLEQQSVAYAVLCQSKIKAGDLADAQSDLQLAKKIKQSEANF